MENIWTGVVFPLILSLTAILGTLYTNHRMSRKSLEAQFDFNRFELITKCYKEITELFYQWEVDAELINGQNKIVEIDKIALKYRTKINILLGEVFLLAKDNEYLEFQKGFPMGTNSLKFYRESLLVAFRRINFSKTNFNKPEDIRLLLKS